MSKDLSEKISRFLWPFRAEVPGVDLKERLATQDAIFQTLFKSKLEIEETELQRRLGKMDHVMSDGDVLRRVNPVHPRKQACTWAPELLEERPDLVSFDTVITGHLCGHIMYFKPSLAEVLAQLSPEQVEEADAFSVKHLDSLPQPYYAHYAVTTLYKTR